MTRSKRLSSVPAMHLDGGSPRRHSHQYQLVADAGIADLFLPEHLRLGAHNWLEFKLAIEAVLSLKGIPLTHLRCAKCPPPLPVAYTAGSEADRAREDARAREKWAADDDLCKTVILLNVRSDHIRLVEHHHERWSAAKLWTLLIQREEEIEKEWGRKVEWLYCIRTLAPWVFLVIVCSAWFMDA